MCYSGNFTSYGSASTSGDIRIGSNYGGQILFKMQNNNAAVEFNISDERG